MSVYRRQRKPFSFPAIPERNHLLLMVALSFLLGCILAHHLTNGAWLWLLAGIGLALAILLHRMDMHAGLGLVICFLALGALRTHAALDIPAPAPGTYVISGLVAGDVRPRSDNCIAFTLTQIDLDGAAVSRNAYVSLHYDDTPPALFDGAEIRFSGRVYHPDGKSGEPHMDFRMWMLRQRLAFGIAAYREVEILNTPETAPVVSWESRIRQACSRALTRVMGENSRVAMALLLGQRDGLSEEEYASFQDLGIAHIMSVSGMHVGILGSLVLLLLRRTKLPRWYRLPLLGVFLVLYCALTGFSASSTRAAIMLFLYTLASLIFRYPDRLTILAAAMLAVLALDPLEAQSAGFILSFTAMLGITLYVPPIQELLERFWPEPPRSPKKGAGKVLFIVQRHFKATLSVAFAAQIGVLLPTMYFFYQLPVYGVVINLFIVPFVSSLLMPLYALTLITSFLPGIGALLGSFSSLLTDFLLHLVRLLSVLPCAVIRVASPPAVTAVGFGLSLVILAPRIPGSFCRRMLASLLTLCVSLSSALLLQPADLRYIQLSAGQADAAILMDGDTTILIDVGSDGQNTLDYLLHERRDVDALFITHLHLDHIGGVVQLMDSDVPIHRIYLSVNARQQKADAEALRLLDALSSKGIPIQELASGDELRYNKTSLRVLWPVRDHVRSGHNANDFPLVLAIDFAGYTLLNTSDLNGGYENYCAFPADVLKVAHHGSVDSTGADYLSFISPRYALITCSSSSRSLPSPDTLQRLAHSGAQILRTDECGDITLSVANGSLIVKPYKERKSP